MSELVMLIDAITVAGIAVIVAGTLRAIDSMKREG